MERLPVGAHDLYLAEGRVYESEVEPEAEVHEEECPLFDDAYPNGSCICALLQAWNKPAKKTKKGEEK